MDQTLKCADCGQDFPFSSGEQEFYASKNLTPPKRCKPCRQAKKAKMFDRQKQQGRQHDNAPFRDDASDFRHE